MGKRIDELTENTTPALEDLLVMVDDPGDTHVTRKVTLENARNTLLETPTLANSQGDVYYYDGSTVQPLTSGTKGQALTTGGAVANPSWQGMTTQGDIEYRSSTTRARLAAGTSGQALTTGGAAANPSWAGMSTQGDVEYHNGTTRSRLAAGTSGQFLRTTGAASNPDWSFGPEPWYDVRDYASIGAAITAIGATVATLVVPNSQTLTANLTVPATLSLVILKGGMIVKASTYTVTINGPFSAGPYQVFSGFDAGNVTFGVCAPNEVHPEWWGENTTPGTTDMLASLNCAVQSIGSIGGTIRLLPCIYEITNVFNVNYNYITIVGTPYKTAIRLNHATRNVMVVESADPTTTLLQCFQISGVAIYKHTTVPTAGTCLYLNECEQFTIRDCRIFDGFINIVIAGGGDGILEDVNAIDVGLLGAETVGAFGLWFRKGPYSTVDTPFGIRVQNCSFTTSGGFYRQFAIAISCCDGLYFTNVLAASAYHADVFFQPEASARLVSTLWTNCYLDASYNAAHTTGGGWWFDGAPTGGYSFTDHSFTGGSIINGSGTWGEYGVYIAASCEVRQVRVSGVNIGYWGTYGVGMASDDSSGVIITGCDIWGNTSAGIYGVAACNRFILTGNIIGYSGQPAQAYGIWIGAGCNRFVIHGNICKNNTDNTITIGVGPTKYVSADNEESADT